MSQVKSNSLLKFLVPVVLFIVVVVIFNPFGGSPATNDEPTGQAPVLTEDEVKVLGLGDTPRDTLATVVGQMKDMREEVERVRQQNEQLKTENARMREREMSIDQRIQQSARQATDAARAEARSEASRATQQAQGLLSEVEQRLNKLGRFGSAGEELPIGLGLEAEPGSAGATMAPAMIWIDPSDARPTKPGPGGVSTQSGFSFPTAFDQAGEGLTSGVNSALAPLDRSHRQLTGDRNLGSGSGKREEGTRPVYTIAQNSTLLGSTAMTALIGRVPVDGTVNDPFPFKVLIGRENLAANGFDLPDVTSAVMSGSATGDWTLSCVRGQIESITFIFEDGTIRTLPVPEDTLQANQQRNTSNTSRIRGGLGYLSDPYGTPCIAGERKSNAREYIGTNSLITAAGAGVAALLSKDTEATNTGSGTVVSDRNAALNSILSGGVEDLRNWANKLYGQAFAAIYVPPHVELAVHIDHELKIDYEPNGRKVAFHDESNRIQNALD